MRYSDFVLQPLKEHKFKTLKDIKYKDITIKAGFRTDGASVPRLLWGLFPPNRTDYLPCAVIHDYLCDLEEYKKADEYFCECLKELRVDKFSRVLMVKAVKIYHKIRYYSLFSKNKNKKIIKF